MKSFLFLSLALLVVFGASFSVVNGEKYFAKSADDTCCESYCYSSDVVTPQHLRMNTKTPYQLAKGSEDVKIPVGCTPSKFWLLARHGTRLPTASKITKLPVLPTFQAQILDNYAKGNKPAVGALCDADLELLANWKWDSNITLDKEGHLTVQGWNDLKGIGQYFKAQFPTLFPEYSQDKYYFQYTKSQRTEASYKGFVAGLFGEGSDAYISAIKSPEVDTLLKPYEHCPLYTELDDALDEATSEVSKFESGELFMKMVEDVSTKAGYLTALDADTVDLMFQMCFYEMGWDLAVKSPWCSVSGGFIFVY